MCNVKRLLLSISLIVMLSVSTVGSGVAAATAASTVGATTISNIDAYVEEMMDKSKIPGMSVVIVKGGETVYQKGFGYADVDKELPVRPETLFELGSTSKAYTALAYIQMEEQGLVNREDPVTKYLPWLETTYEGKPAPIRLKHLLYHTSGIPFKSISDIPIAEDGQALEATVRTQIGQKLDDEPGETYSYATINYDVLGLIIQQQSGMSYEAYIQQHVLAPLKLSDTYLFREEAAANGELAQGYKYNMLRAAAYDAPMYRGNTPAGYVISNSLDVATWLKIQMGTVPEAKSFEKWLVRAHEPDRSVSPAGDGSSYAGGWSVYQDGTGMLAHAGANPNYSSYFAVRPHDGYGVAVLTNMNSPYTITTAQGIMNMMHDKEVPEPGSDMYKSIDMISSVVLLLTTPVILLVLWLTSKAIWQAVRGTRSYVGRHTTTIVGFSIFAAFMVGLAYCFYQIPSTLFWGVNWPFVEVWAPNTLPYAVFSMYTTMFLFGIYFLFTTVFPKSDDRSFFAITLLSVASGFGNALIIFIVNETLNRDIEKFQSGLFVYFVLGIAIYVFGQKLVRTRLVRIANDMVYEKRMELLGKILNTSYQRIEGVEEGKIPASLNNDTETISGFSNIVITGATSLVTLISCFVYMGMISPMGVLMAIGFIVVAAGLHYFIGLKANQLWEQTRDIQNVFFRFINDLTGGVKELSLNKDKRTDFQQDMQDNCHTYRVKRIGGDLKFANVNVIGELLFTFVIGAVVFLFPLLFSDLKVSTLRNYVFVLLYMTGPVHGILGTIPNLFRVRISWNRINQLSKELDSIQEAKQQVASSLEDNEPVEIKLQAVEYHYGNSEGERFAVGPIDCSFRTGEITFITGGNGSGKSTLAKLITGLYEPVQGGITINDQSIAPRDLSQQFSAIFSDFYLFDKLYGVPYSTKQSEIAYYLNVLHLQDKVEIRDGALNTTKLSTGQRKRLALLISYLEDRPICLFDEWAADQDPEYRAFFYHTLLPELKQRGKCIIAITHDDRYFHLADQVIKMELGQVVQIVQNEENRELVNSEKG
ncbi:cyclic peptide export ABC transporter [Paenibacillus arenosi]|uniref:Cyclic peptide export ABC transporter n=1 Tax=Paenibacillus arenosi TaxID=2774142 RepID=A0ABR9AZ73_9BACL|nr:cyclic peptide export ABC transporter [Paenibacillus arenosi]MBD8498500.1 cyclic peptide export ABC transporter [Paenibacillus arenosi]